MTAEAGSRGVALRVAVAQTSAVLGDIDANLAEAERVIIGLAGQADLVVFPELCSTGYSLDGLDLAALAEPVPDGPTVRRLADAAARARVAVCAGVAERDGTRVYDTVVALDADGAAVGCYRKTHLHPTETSTFAPGDDLVVVPLGRLGVNVGLAICFEHAFPEVFAELALAEADVIAIPSAVPDGFQYLLELRTRARAQDNQVFVAAANLAGDDGRTRWCGGSVIVDPRGDVVAAAGDAPEVIVATCPLERITTERTQEPVLHHRRPELYRRLRRQPEADVFSEGGTA